MKLLTAIDKKNTTEEELTKDDLRFLYEFDQEIEGFGYQKDPRIEEILLHIDIKEDLSFITGYSKEEISTTEEEALSGGIKFHFGNLYLASLTSAEGLELPETMNGNLYLRGLTSAEGLELPETMNGKIHLTSLTSAEGLKLPETMNGNFDLNGLTSAEGLNLPKTIDGDLYLGGLTSTEGLNLSETIIKGRLYLSGLASTDEIERIRRQYPTLRIDI